MKDTMQDSAEPMPTEKDCRHLWQAKSDGSGKAFCVCCGANITGVWVRDFGAAHGQWFCGQQSAKEDVLFVPAESKEPK